ncbi:MAG TPA: L-ribulose-5-phosphate 4-epimerase AraD [Candidatus Dormibacteraeota bacterium]|nr:L-ribulose-5-phosphate 4-epimerase AraD [Candidatus Dormibacteraeota bacterium]
MLASLREEVLEANLELVRRGLAVDTFGNASGISREKGLVVIKPSGIPYEKLRAKDLVVTDLEGKTVEGVLRASSDLATHIILYRKFSAIGGIAHTHSRSATTWAQSGREIPCFGTTHADYFRGAIPVTNELSVEEIERDYELNTGLAIVRRLEGADPLQMPAVLVVGHAPFCWGISPADAAHNAWMLEEVAEMALATVAANPAAKPLSSTLLDKHFLRKHGASATYGQKKSGASHKTQK